VFTESLLSNGYTRHNTKNLGNIPERGGCDGDKASRIALVCCPPPSLVHLIAPVFNISHLRIDGQAVPK
jgi:hypothetical protein